MINLFRKSKRKAAEGGQALIEFALVAPVLTLLLLGLIDFGAILFSYAQASGSLRDGLRYAEILGYSDSTGIPYLDCAAMEDAAENNFFTSSHNVTIKYVSANGSVAGPFDGSGSDAAGEYTCPPGGMNDTQKSELNLVLVNGDMLQIDLVATVDPFFLPIGQFNLNFSGQRSLVRELPITLAGTGSDFGDYDPNGGSGGSDPDADSDGIPDSTDNCINTANGGQQDADSDGVGDACDNCPADANADQADADTDGIGDVCDSGGSGDPDADSDGVPDSTDNCVANANADQADDDSDGVGNVCDNCPSDSNPDQTDTDTDGEGDACETGAPAKPDPFTAVANCTTGDVDFSWSIVTPPDPTRVEIYNDSDILLSTVASGTTCDDCDTISTQIGEECYYAVAYSGTVPEYEGPRSDPSCVACITEPDSPTAFSATCDDATGDISFNWNWGSDTPYPTSTEIRRQSDDSVIATITSTTSGCTGCDNISVPGTRSYYIVSIHGTGSNAVESTVGTDQQAQAECESTSLGATVRVCLWRTTRNNGCNAQGTVYPDEGITLLNEDTSTQTYRTTGSDGCFIFTGLSEADYQIEVPDQMGSRTIRAKETEDGTCIKNDDDEFFEWYPLYDGESKEIIFWYK